MAYVVSMARAEVAMEANITKDYQHSTAHKFVYACEAVIIPIILIAAIITNTECLILLPRTRIVNTFKTCLIALSLSDLLAATFGFAQMMVEIGVYGGDVPYGKWEDLAALSYSLFYVFTWFICNSAVIVIAIVIIRHITISRPLVAKRHLTPCRVKLVCLAIFLVNLVLLLPTSMSVLWQSCHKDNVTEICVQIDHDIGMNNLEKIKYYMYALTCMYGPVMVVIYVICLIGIKLSLNRTNRAMRDLVDKSSSVYATNMRLKKTARITRTLLLILILDTICSVPLCIQGLALLLSPKEAVYTDDNAAYKIFDVIAEIFINLRPTYNFWLYTFTHQEFRESAKRQCFSEGCLKKYPGFVCVSTDSPDPTNKSVESTPECSLDDVEENESRRPSHVTSSQC